MALRFDNGAATVGSKQWDNLIHFVDCVCSLLVDESSKPQLDPWRVQYHWAVFKFFVDQQLIGENPHAKSDNATMRLFTLTAICRMKCLFNTYNSTLTFCYS